MQSLLWCLRSSCRWSHGSPPMRMLVLDLTWLHWADCRLSARRDENCCWHIRYGFSFTKIDLKTKVVTFEYVAVRIASMGASSIIVIVYRPGSMRPDKTFFSEFIKFLGAVAAFSTSITIVGNINIRLDRPDDGDTVMLLNVISSYDLSQFVTVSK